MMNTTQTNQNICKVKTRYIKPNIAVLTVRTTNMICLSIQSGDANTSSEQEGGGYMLSRQNSFWDDED